jgi:Ca2+-binding EF-hand superfamily protein
MSKCFGILVAAALVLLPANAWSDAAALATLDTDHDGTLDLAEAQSAAWGIFSSLDGNHTGTLDPRELSGRLDQATFAAADHDIDGSLDPSEYAALIEARFKTANTDADGTLDETELGSPAGARLLALIY